MIMFQNMGVMGIIPDKSIQHKIYTLRNTITNNWGIIPLNENIYNKKKGWFKTRSIKTGYNQVTISSETFQSGGAAIMAV